MKESFKIVAREKSERGVSCERLRSPKKTWREQRADENRCEQINQQSGCILQDC